MDKHEIAVLGGGCFWCTEAVFQSLRGVSNVTSGYAGGTTSNPTYQQVCSGSTGHAEVIKIDYDPSQITYQDLLTVFFASHDPSTPNQQGNDVGTQYRSVIFYTSPGQEQIANNFINALNSSSQPGRKIVTEIAPLTKFYPAELSHQDYYNQNREQAYCQLVINPKLEKAQKDFTNLLRTHEIK